jgi:hypothetical protein
MIKALIIVLLLTAAISRRSSTYGNSYSSTPTYYTSPQYSTSSNYQLSPSLPPNAFVGQYYTCDFRVQGLTNPTYQFSNLPSFLQASSSGRIEGTPTLKGTFTINVQYSSGSDSG